MIIPWLFSTSFIKPEQKKSFYTTFSYRMYYLLWQFLNEAIDHRILKVTYFKWNTETSPVWSSKMCGGLEGLRSRIEQSTRVSFWTCFPFENEISYSNLGLVEFESSILFWTGGHVRNETDLEKICITKSTKTSVFPLLLAAVKVTSTCCWFFWFKLLRIVLPCTFDSNSNYFFWRY